MKPIERSNPIYTDYDYFIKPEEDIYDIFQLKYDNPQAVKIFTLGILGTIICLIYFIFLVFLLPIIFLFIMMIILFPSVYFMMRGSSDNSLRKKTQKTPYNYLLTNDRIIIEEGEKTHNISYNNIRSITQKHERSNTYRISIRLIDHVDRSYFYMIQFIPNSTNFYNTLNFLTSKYSEIKFKVKPYSFLKSILTLLFPGLLISAAGLLAGMLGIFSN